MNILDWIIQHFLLPLLSALIPIITAVITSLSVDRTFLEQRRSKVLIPLYSVISENLSVNNDSAPIIKKLFSEIVRNPENMQYSSSALLDAIHCMDLPSKNGKYENYDKLCESVIIDLLKDERYLRIPSGHFPGAQSLVKLQRWAYWGAFICYLIGAMCLSNILQISNTVVHLVILWIATGVAFAFAVCLFVVSNNIKGDGKRCRRYVSDIKARSKR